MSLSRSLQLMAAATALFAASALTACSTSEPCGVPGVATACVCANGAQGARACLPDRSLGSCDCSGAIGLPNAITSGSGGTLAAGSGGTLAAGSGGSSGQPFDAGKPDDDDSGRAGAAGSGGTGGMSGHGGSGGAGGTMSTMGAAYRGCKSTSDCDTGSSCVMTPSGSATISVCAPACVNTSDCPVPEGKYDAVVGCTVGYCRLDCTPVLFAPLLSCPTGMTCVAALLGAAYCHDTDGK